MVEGLRFTSSGRGHPQKIGGKEKNVEGEKHTATLSAYFYGCAGKQHSSLSLNMRRKSAVRYDPDHRYDRAIRREARNERRTGPVATVNRHVQVCGNPK
jgi:hypothetical protein